MAESLTGSDYLNIGLGLLLITSEVLPYLKKHKGNGIIESIICLLKGSSCMAEKLATTLEAVNTDTLPSVADAPNNV
jgi:hypothetical protein